MLAGEGHPFYVWARAGVDEGGVAAGYAAARQRSIL